MYFYLTSHKEASKTTPQPKACYKLTLKIRDQTKPTNIITNKVNNNQRDEEPLERRTKSNQTNIDRNHTKPIIKKQSKHIPKLLGT